MVDSTSLTHFSSLASNSSCYCCILPNSLFCCFSNYSNFCCKSAISNSNSWSFAATCWLSTTAGFSSMVTSSSYGVTTVLGVLLLLLLGALVLLVALELVLKLLPKSSFSLLSKLNAMVASSSSGRSNSFMKSSKAVFISVQFSRGTVFTIS